MKDSYFDEISEKQIKNAKIYGSRGAFIDSLKEDIRYLELGAVDGDMAIDLIEKAKVKRILLIGTFNSLDDQNNISIHKRWTTKEENYNFIMKRFQSIKNIFIIKKNINEFLSFYNGSFNFIYINKLKKYEKQEIILGRSILLLENSGIVGISDYSLAKFFLLRNQDWYIDSIVMGNNIISEMYIKKLEYYSFIN
jgi:hypothetical protein